MAEKLRDKCFFNVSSWGLLLYVAHFEIDYLLKGHSPEIEMDYMWQGQIKPD